jgi:hypothetical protein
MAKSSKVEDYWRQNNVDSLFKDLTHLLVQRMPTDPAVAIVQYLQKKFPKSFKTSTDNNNYMSTAYKTTASILQTQTISSPTSDVNNYSTGAIEMQRRGSNQSQISGIVTIPTIGSDFTNLFKQDVSTGCLFTIYEKIKLLSILQLDSSMEAPELNLRNFMLLNRMSQHAVRLRKDIRSHHDILEDELIKPTKHKANISSTANMPVNSVPENFQHAETHGEPSVKQLVEYKQRIRLANDRRLHEQKLAELAKRKHDKDEIVQSGLHTKSGEVHQQQKSGDDHTLSHAVPQTSSTKFIHKSIVKSKEEEEILNDENVFQPRRQRQRERGRYNLSTSPSNTTYARKQYMGDYALSTKRGYENSMPTMQLAVCKVCGSVINNEGNQSIRYSQQISGKYI